MVEPYTVLMLTAKTDHSSVVFDCNCSCQPHVMQLIKDLELSVYPQYTSGTKLLQLSSGPRVSRYASEIPSLPLFAVIDLHLFMRKVGHFLL